LGDIGHHFPDDDAALKGVDSRILLRRVVAQMEERGYEIGNVDMTIIAQRPKLADHIAAMRMNIASDLKTDDSNCNVKATTTEKLGFAGREEGIAVHAVALIKEIDRT
jgi:2-C-methyl-D-erythritol 2,4-cyclodiphosphate synthase